jgi:hypothetical protein
LLPSADEAIASKFVIGALFGVQVWANEELTALNKPHKNITAGSGAFICVFIYSNIRP